MRGRCKTPGERRWRQRWHPWCTICCSICENGIQPPGSCGLWLRAELTSWVPGTSAAAAAAANPGLPVDCRGAEIQALRTPV